MAQSAIQVPVFIQLWFSDLAFGFWMGIAQI